MPDTDQQLTAGDAATTEKSGTAGEAAGKADPVVAGLTKAHNKEREARLAAEARLAEALTKLGDDEERGTKMSRLEKENLGLKVALKYSDVAPILQKAFEKGAINPEFVDDDFVAAIRAASNGGAPAPKTEDTESPAHNPVRSTSSVSAMESLKGMNWPE